MSVKERLRLDTFLRVKRSELSVAKAALLLGVSLRQGRRLWKSFRQKGDSGLVHGLRGRLGAAANRASGCVDWRWRSTASTTGASGRRWRRSIWARATAWSWAA